MLNRLNAFSNNFQFKQFSSQSTRNCGNTLKLFQMDTLGNFSCILIFNELNMRVCFKKLLSLQQRHGVGIDLFIVVYALIGQSHQMMLAMQIMFANNIEMVVVYLCISWQNRSNNGILYSHYRSITSLVEQTIHNFIKC